MMDGIKIELPYNGQKVTQGYMGKAPMNNSLFNPLQKVEFSERFCILDLTKFIFKYAKAPNEKYTEIQLKEIEDVVLEYDPKQENI